MANRSDYLNTIPENAKSWKSGTLYATPDGHIYKKASEGFLECKKTPKGKDKGNAIYYFGLDGKDKVSFSHNIIAELFCPKESNLQKTVRAKDNNLENDNSDNLYWYMNKEAKRKLKELERNRNSFDKLPSGFVEIPTFEEVYINKEAVVIVKGPDGRYSYLNKTLYNNKNTPVYMMSIYNYKTKKSRNIGLHVLMGLAFIEKPSEKHVNVYFKDGNGLNLNIDNLYWCTHVAPVNLRQEAQNRFFKTLPEECLVGQYNTFVSKSGRVFISKNDGYLELNHCVDKKSGDIKVHIPVDAGVTRSLKVITLMSDLYLPMSETETKEICFKDNNRLNINLDNLYRRKRIYNVNGSGKIDYSIFNTIPEEVVESRDNKGVYISRKGNVYFLTKDNRYKLAKKSIMSYSKSRMLMAKINTPLCNKQYVKVAYELYCSFVDFNNHNTKILYLDNNPENIELNNLYIIPEVKKSITPKKTKKEKIKLIKKSDLLYSKSIPDNFINCLEDENLWINEFGIVYLKNEEKGYKKLNIKYKKFGKNDYEEPYVYYYMNGNHTHKLSVLMYEAFSKESSKGHLIEFIDGNPLNCFYNNLKLIVKSNYIKSENKKNLKETIFEDKLPSGFVKCKDTKDLFINEDGIVYQYIVGKGYKKCTITTELKHNHNAVIVRYLNENGIYRVKHLARLLAENFLLDGDDCPRITFMDNNPENVDLNNIGFAGDTQIKCLNCNTYNCFERVSCRNCGCLLKKTEKNTSFSINNNPRYRFTIVDEIPSEAKKTYKENVYITENGDFYVIYDEGIYKYPDILKSDKKYIILKDRTRVTVKNSLAEAFIDNPNNYSKIACIDRNLDNLSISNLKWVSEEELKKYRPLKVCPECGINKIDYSAKTCDDCKAKFKELVKEERANIVIEEAKYLLEKTNPKDNTKIILEELVNGLTTTEIWNKYNWTRQYVNSCLNKARLKASDEYQNKKMMKKLRKIYEKKFSDVVNYEFFEKAYPFVVRNCENSEKVIIRNTFQTTDMIGNQFKTLEELILHTDRQLSINRMKRKETK